MKRLLWLCAFALACADVPEETIENEPELGVITEAVEYAVAPDILYTTISPPSPWYAALMATWQRAQPNTSPTVVYYPAGTNVAAIQMNYNSWEQCWVEGGIGFRCESAWGSRYIACPHGLGANTKDSYRMTSTSALRAWGAAYPLLHGVPGVMPMSGGQTRANTTDRTLRCAYQWSVNTSGHYLQVSNP